MIMQRWDLREFHVRVNWPLLIRQVPVMIPQVKAPVWGLPNPIRQVVLQISHRHSYPPYCAHLHPPSLCFSSTTLPSSQAHQVQSSLSVFPCHHHEFTMSAAYTEYSIHRVQHTPNTAYTVYSIHRVQHTPRIVCHPLILTIPCWPLNVASASGILPYRYTPTNQLSIWASKVMSPCHSATVWS